MGVRQSQVRQRAALDPGARIPSEQGRAHAAGGPAGGFQQGRERGAVLDLIYARISNRSAQGQEGGAGLLGDSECAKPTRAVACDQGHVSQCLGVRRHPTLVNNAETLAHVALIARHGPRWFRALGLSEQPGSTLLTLSGPVAYPGVYEVEYGASLSSLLEAAGGTTSRVRAALFGGYAGTWVEGGALADLALSNAHLAPYGATLGAGVVLLLSEDACPVAETARVTRWLALQSAGQCGPCVHGLDALAETFERVCAGAAPKHAGARLEQLAGLVSRRGACAHPDGTARFALSALDVFAQEFADHVRHGACAACARPSQMPLPRIAAVA